MKKWQFVLIMRELGFTDYFIGEVLNLRDRERAQGIMRRWEDYMPGYKEYLKRKEREEPRQ